MSADIDTAMVYYGAKKAGVLKKNKSGYEFLYDSQYLSDSNAVPVSLSLPLSQAKYEAKQLFPFFEGLLPEGWLLEVTSVAAKIDKQDKFKLLLHTGRDPIGAVSIKPIEDILDE